MHTNNQEAAPLPFQTFAAPLRSALAHMHKGRRTLRPQSKSIVPTDHASNEHGSHTRGKSTTYHRRSNSEISILYAGGKYIRVSKGKVHQSITHTYLHMNKVMSSKFMLPLSLKICSGWVIFN